MRAVFFLVLLVFLAATASADEVSDVISKVNGALCNVLLLLYVIAPAIGSLVITMQGIKWIASEADPGARKEAKEGVIHVVVGLIIVLLAIPIVSMIMVDMGDLSQCTVTGAYIMP